jgi:hypothetical protein
VILANPAYLGMIRWNDKLYGGQHEPLIDKTTFEQAQQILARRRKDGQRLPQEHAVLARRASSPTIIPTYCVQAAVRTMHGIVGDPGFEPGTSSLSEKRSNRLS